MRLYKRGEKWHLDVVINGQRYRESLDTTDGREAKTLANKRITEISSGKGASKSGREFARKPFNEAADTFVEDRRIHVSGRTHELDRERLRPLRLFFGKKPLLRIRAEDIAAYQRGRLDGSIRVGEDRDNVRLKRGVGNRTVNMEFTVLRQMMRRAKVWSVVSEDVKMLPEKGRVVGRVLSAEHKKILFRTAAAEDRWLVVHCAAVLAAYTTCRGVELKNLRWSDVDLFAKTIQIRRSKTDAGHRAIPLTSDAVSALARLRRRAELLGASEPAHYVFPACESNAIVPDKPQKTWRTAWRSLVKAAAREAGRSAASGSLAEGLGLRAARAAYRLVLAAFKGFRFHDLRHQAITELAEHGASDATLMAIAGHMSRQMLEHYSHVRMEAKRAALNALEGGLMGVPPREDEPEPRFRM